MTIAEFEQKLKALDPKFAIFVNPNNPELAGVYYDRNDIAKTGYIITVPAENIEDDFRASYSDSTGHPHNWGNKVLGVCIEHLRRLNEMPGYKDEFYEPLQLGKKISANDKHVL